MKKIFLAIIKQFKYLFKNPFWRMPATLILIGAAVVTDSALIYLYMIKYRQAVPLMPIIYSLAVFLLNLVLANISYRKEPMISYIFLGGGLLVQLLFLSYLQFTNLASGF